MEIYFSPLACSMATRIAVLEAGATAEFIALFENRNLVALRLQTARRRESAESAAARQEVGSAGIVGEACERGDGIINIDRAP